MSGVSGERSTEQVPTDIYPVGVLSALRTCWGALTVRNDLLAGKRLGIVRHELRKTRHYLATQVKARNWRAVRNHFNGYLAEHDRCAHNAGRGWTRKAARRRVEAICDQHIADALSTGVTP